MAISSKTSRSAHDINLKVKLSNDLCQFSKKIISIIANQNPVTNVNA